MHSGFVAQSAQTQPSLYGSHVPLFVQFVGSEQYGSASQSAQTQSSAVVHVPSGTHVAWQPGAAVQSEHAHDSPAWHVPFGAPPVQAADTQPGVPMQSAHEQGSPISHIMLATPPVQVGLGALTHSGFVAQSAQTQPSLYGSHVPLFVQFVGLEQYGSASQSAQTQSSAVVHVPSGTHVAWQPADAVQSEHAHDSPAWHVPFGAPPVQTADAQPGVPVQSAHEQGSPISHIMLATPPVQVGLGALTHSGFVAQSAQTQPSRYGLHVPSLVQFVGSEQYGSASQSEQTQSSAVVHVPSGTHVAWQPGAAVQSGHTQDSPAWHIPFGAPPVQPDWQAGVAAQSAHEQGSPISHIPFATIPVHVAFGPHCGAIAQSAHEQGSPISHIPLAVPPVQVGFGPHAGVAVQSAHAHVSPISHMPSVSQATAHSGFVAQSAHTQPSR
jgi:hypothetical protein